MSRFALLAAIGLALVGPAHHANAADEQVPKISKPRPAPDSPQAAMLPLPQADFDSSLAIGGDELKARKIETRLSVDVQVNGRGPYKFIVDSGADTSVVGLRIARDLQLPLGKPAILHSMTAREFVDRVKVAELKLGPTTFRDLHLPALRESDVGGDGMVGIDALVQQRLLLDFEKKLIKVEDARTPMKILPGDIVVTARRQRGQLILTRVSAAGVPLDAIIDTGSQVTIGNRALRDKLIRGNRKKFLTAPMTGVTGAKMEIEFAVIGELELGPVVFRDVPIAFADVPPFKVFGLSDEPALLLGTDLLETFRKVSLDFRARKVRFQLRSCKTTGVVISTSRETMTRLGSSGADACAT